MGLKADNIAKIVGRLLFILLFVYLLVIIKESVSKFEQEEREAHAHVCVVFSDLIELSLIF